MDLNSMKHAELRSLAKELGLKANIKTDKLRKVIRKRYQQEKTKENSELQQKEVSAVQENEVDQENKETSCKEEIYSRAAFVNPRRGKRNGTQRKISDTVNVKECEPNIAPSAVQDAIEVAGSTAPCRGRGGKKRKLSSKDKESVPSGSEQQQPDVKDEASLHGDTEDASKITKASKIPGYQSLWRKNKPVLKPVTPNFKKLHEAHFNKMESIDSYVQRKAKLIETCRGSVKELKRANRSMFSPPPVNKKPAEEKHRHTMLSASKASPNKSAGEEDPPFRPSVLSIRRINVRFHETACEKGYKGSMVETPARMSPCVASSTPQKQTADGRKTSNVKTTAFSATKTTGAFVFTGNASSSATPGKQKPKFDLKASLSRPLTYKPYTGKLKPFGESKENTTGNTSLISVTPRQKNYKQHQTQTREDRRAKQVESRKQKKESMLGARRGLVIM